MKVTKFHKIWTSYWKGIKQNIPGGHFRSPTPSSPVWLGLSKEKLLSNTAWKVSKYGVFSGPHFTAFGLNMERYEVSRRIQFKCGKIRTRKKSVFGHFSRSVRTKYVYVFLRECCEIYWNSLFGKSILIISKMSISSY